MTQADRVLSTPPTNTSAIDHPMMFPPVDPTAARIPTTAAVMTKDLDPRDVLADLFGSGDFPPEILLDPAHAAEVVVQRLRDAGFEIVPA